MEGTLATLVKSLKLRRKILRDKFDKKEEELHGGLREYEENSRNATKLEEMKTTLNYLEDIANRLFENEDKIQEALSSANLVDELTAEFEIGEEYRLKLIKCRDRYKYLTAPGFHGGDELNNAEENRLGKWQGEKFDGDTKKWFKFWKQFKKAHDDEAIEKEVKYAYLLDATTSKSEAQKLVKRFPRTPDGYDAAIEGLKENFGNDEMLVEAYCRDLISMTIKASKDRRTKRPRLNELRSKISDQLQALQFLNVNKKLYVPCFYPLIEEVLPNNVLAAWKATRESKKTDYQCVLEELMDHMNSSAEDSEQLPATRRRDSNVPPNTVNGYNNVQSDSTFAVPSSSRSTRSQGVPASRKRPHPDSQQQEAREIQTSYKHRDFIREPFDDKPVDAIPGVGKALAEILKDKGIIEATQIYGQWNLCRRNEERFKEWLQKITTKGKANKKSCDEIHQAFVGWSNENHSS